MSSWLFKYLCYEVSDEHNQIIDFEVEKDPYTDGVIVEKSPITKEASSSRSVDPSFETSWTQGNRD